MILISLMLAATPPAAARPDAQRREATRSVPAQVAVRSKRLIELEAAVRALPTRAAEQGHGSGPKGM